MKKKQRRIQEEKNTGKAGGRKKSRNLEITLKKGRRRLEGATGIRKKSTEISSIQLWRYRLTHHLKLKLPPIVFQKRLTTP
jgi:hypothetical protein